MINLIGFYDEFTRPVDMVDSVYFDFHKALKPISHSVFVGVLWSGWMDYMVREKLDGLPYSKGSGS